jgi:hypothetical protein
MIVRGLKMLKKRTIYVSFFMLMICFSTFLYFDGILGKIDPIILPDSDDIDSYEIIPDLEIEEVKIDPPDDPTTNISGDYKTVAYFTQDSFVNLDENGYSFEWEKYDDVKDDAANFRAVDLLQHNDSANPSIFWHPLDSWGQLRSTQLIDGHRMNSTVFSPAFDFDTHIQGNVYFMVSGDTWYSASSDWYLRITLGHFNPSTGETSYLTSTQGYFDDTKNHPDGRNITSNNWNGWVYEATLPSSTIIPAGHRLRAIFECMLTSASYTGPTERCQIRSGISTYSVEWNVDSSNNTYDNYYLIQNSLESIGMQVLMYQENYPTIDLTGLVNNTIYSEETNGTLTISSDAILSRYKWDSDSYTPFTSPTVISLPSTASWHQLTVQAYDSFNNLAEAYYKIGYDPSVNDVILNSHLNNSFVNDGQTLDFSIFDAISVTYEWDKSGTEISLTDPYDILLDDGFTGQHQLTINYTDFYKSDLYEFFFTFDNAPPDISLFDLENETTQPQGKNIDVFIDEISTPIYVEYRWDSDAFTEWTPLTGSLYRTYLPIAPGWHNLTVFANDTLGNSDTVFYTFNTSTTLLKVELYNLVNNTYYQGGNIVEIAIENDNGTIIYNWDQWGSDTWKVGSTSGGIMTLSGDDALNTTAGKYFLTVIVGNSENLEVEFRFVFTVDKEKPTIIQLPTDDDYNGTRFLDTAILSFIIADNWTAIENLEIYYSFDGLDNQTLYNPYQIYLVSLPDGSHNLTIIAIDIAGNYYQYYITFIVDTTYPYLPFNIIGDVYYDGYRYAPPGAQVNALATDADPGVRSFYSWSGGEYIEYIGFFFLPLSEEHDRLYIKANDTLGNTRYRSYWITLDDTPPTITLNFLANNTNINDLAPIEFEIDDFRDESVKYREYKWLIDDDPTIIYENDFEVFLRPQHITNASITEAIISLTARDALNLEYSCTYRFILDYVAPSVNLISTTNESYISGGEILEFSVPSSDIASFSYKWDVDENFQEITGDPWYVPAPFEDGNRTLNLLLADNTSMGIYPNYAEYTFVFILDDIEINYVTPNDFDTDYEVTMKYGEEFNFSINVVDRVNQTEIEDLKINIIREHPLINLSVNFLAYNDTLYNGTNYNFTILATNITNSAYSYIEIELYQFTFNKQIIRVYVKVDRQEGHLLVLDAPESVIYEDDITIEFQLRDYSNITGQTLEYFALDGITSGFTYQLIDPVNYIYTLTFGSDDFFTSKGPKTYVFYVESNFYFGIRNDSNSLSITIQAIPITISIDIDNTEVIYGTDLVASATLLRADSTAITLQNVTFMFEIHYKNGSIMERNITTITNLEGLATVNLEITQDIDYVIAEVVYLGGDYYDSVSDQFDLEIYAISAGLSLQTILIIVGGIVLLIIVLSFVIYRVAKPKPFEDLLEKVTEVDISENMTKMSPGVILSIFDQTKGPIPLIQNQSFDNEKYIRRMRIGVENFLLKISDQAYSSLGFEEHDQRRRIGSINLPNEDMIGFIHGIQLENKAVRGGFENLSLIVLADIEFGGFLLANQEFMFPEIDELIFALRAKKQLDEIEEYLAEIRKKSVIIMITASKNQKKDKKELEQYK